MLLVSLSLCLSLSLSSPAHADTPPSVWDRARSPAAADSYRIHLEVQRRLATGETARAFGFSASHESEKLSVRTMLERANAEKSPDVLLRFDLGLAYLLLAETEGHSYYKRAAEVLGAALADAPDAPSAEQGWARLADACGHIGDHECERRAYTRLLDLTTEDVRWGPGLERGTVDLNLAEAEMHLGNMKESIAGYREAMRIATRYPSRELAAMVMWGLAVALDRSGDSVAADKQARDVLEMQRSSGMTGILRSRSVFFYPDYEINWYDGVGAAAVARAATAPAEAARYWKAAEDAFGAYVRGATRPGVSDRWLELAKVRAATAKAEREKAEKKRGKVPAQPHLDDEETPL